MGLTAARPFVVSAMVTLMLLSRPGHAAEGDGSIADGGAFFSPEALSEANDIVNTIRTLHDRDVRVETYRDVPSHLKDDLARDGLEKFYDDWLNRRARQLGVQGVFVLVTRSPGRVQVGVDRSTQRKAFTADDREVLRDSLAVAFQDARYDEGLLNGLRFVKQRLDQNTLHERSPTVPVAGARN